MTQIAPLKKLFAICHKLKATTTIVLVTGVFDLIHSEHTKLLLAAKKQGNILLVGLEPDVRVAQLKGQGRPINNILQRLKNLAALNLADYVFALPPSLSTRQGREDLIKRLKPHILAASASTPNLPEKRRIMKLINGSVKIVLPHNPAISTSKLTFDFSRKSNKIVKV